MRNHSTHLTGYAKIVQDLLNYAKIELNGPNCYDPQIHNPLFYKRILQKGSLGLGESYMDSWWDCECLDEFICRVIRADIEQKAPKNYIDVFKILMVRLRNLQTPARAWQVGKEHYDLGNDLYSKMLDPYMQYSCGYWKDCTTLEQAQEQKLKLICEKLQLKAGERVLDIGCGWGGLSYYMAKNYGVSVVGLTISKEQKALAEERCKGLMVEIRLQDYRDLNEQFDKVVSVGMFEHVGSKNYQTYFDVVKRTIKEDGLFLLHTIGSNSSGVNVDTWINKYIFPNGELPSIERIAASIRREFVIEDWHNFGPDYDKTLMAWYERFTKAWPELEANYSPRFKRMFDYYLLACAGAFRSRSIQLWQVLLSPNGVAGGIRVPR